MLVSEELVLVVVRRRHFAAQDLGAWDERWGPHGDEMTGRKGPRAAGLDSGEADVNTDGICGVRHDWAMSCALLAVACDPVAWRCNIGNVRHSSTFGVLQVSGPGRKASYPTWLDREPGWVRC